MRNYKLTINTSRQQPTTSTLRSPIKVPMRYEHFALSFLTKLRDGEFLGRSAPTDETNQRRQFKQIGCVAKTILSHGVEELEPTPQALARTKRAAQHFFFLSYQLLEKNNSLFPLAGRNKCLGMVALPNSKLVIIAISQDKDPKKDESLRQAMLNFLNELNASTNTWTFELASIPTKAQYFMPRTLSMRSPHAAPNSSVEPRTRCVEVALMAALCKAGRTNRFSAKDAAVMAFGATLWANSINSEAINHFEGIERNKTYAEKPPLEIKLSDKLTGWIDIWEPCSEHCKIYRYEMLAIGAAGGMAGSFFEARSECGIIKQHRQPKKQQTPLTHKQKLLIGMASGLINAALCVSANNNYQRSTTDSASKVSFVIATITTALGLLMMIANKHSSTQANKNKKEKVLQRSLSFEF